MNCFIPLHFYRAEVMGPGRGFASPGACGIATAKWAAASWRQAAGLPPQRQSSSTASNVLCFVVMYPPWAGLSPMLLLFFRAPSLSFRGFTHVAGTANVVEAIKKGMECLPHFFPLRRRYYIPPPHHQLYFSIVCCCISTN